ncbi:dihydrofolate reductase [bacterium]|nr:dihydrofolate reductase [bacterium]
MRSKTSVFIATSLDGFIARKDGSIDWLEVANTWVPEGEDCGYHAFFSTVDVLVMGRASFETVVGFETWPYGDKRVVVLSRREMAIPAALARTVTASSEAPRDLVNRLTAEGAKHLYIDGGITIQRFFAEDLIDELTITTIPVLLGEGRPLFGPLEKDIALTHVATKAYDFGFVQAVYRVAR